MVFTNQSSMGWIMARIFNDGCLLSKNHKLWAYRALGCRHACSRRYFDFHRIQTNHPNLCTDNVRLLSVYSKTIFESHFYVLQHVTTNACPDCNSNP